MFVTIIGGGLAGCEAAWQVSKRGIRVRLIEMRPLTPTKAHKTDFLAELVCSNSLRGAALSNGVGLLKKELELFDSLIMRAALQTQVPAGGALAVDRLAFSSHITEAISLNPLIELRREEIKEIPEFGADNPVIIASGPLTARPLAEYIERFLGQESLAFFDAISPVVTKDSLDLEKLFFQSRYDKGEGKDYLNVPLDRDQYLNFVHSVAAAEKYSGNADVESDSLDKLRPFEGCMPIEDMIERGEETLRYGPFKPKGLRDPKTGKSPHAVLQLRQDDKDGILWNMVGMQTRMKRHEQQRIFRALPGLENADFVRYGTVHRNTFIDSPRCLSATLEMHKHPGLFFAGQITGVEGYVESTAGGLVAGINAAHRLMKQPLLELPAETAIGALMRYISDPTRRDFQPMNISYGLISDRLIHGKLPLKPKPGKQVKRELIANEALKIIRNTSRELPLLKASADSPVPS